MFFFLIDDNYYYFITDQHQIKIRDARTNRWWTLDAASWKCDCTAHTNTGIYRKLCNDAVKDYRLGKMKGLWLDFHISVLKKHLEHPEKSI